MRVLLIPDTPSWAVGILSDGLIAALPKNWQVDKIPKRRVGSRLQYLRRHELEYDVVYSWMWHFTRKFLNDFHHWFPNSKLMVGCTGYKRLLSRNWKKIMSSGKIDGLNTWAKIMYEIIKDEHPNTWLTRHGVDTDTMHPRSKPLGEPFLAGWCGNVLHSAKQCDILGKLDYPVLVHGRNIRLLKKYSNIRLDPGLIPYPEMSRFYHAHHVHLCVSKRETGPLPILEAAACGMPVISTAVGVAPELLQPEWIIDECWDKEVIAHEVNKRLHILANDPELRDQVGRRNRAEIMKNWTWKDNIDEWMRFFRS